MPDTVSVPLKSSLAAAIVPVVILPPSIVVTLLPKAVFILVKVTNPVKFWKVKGSLITIDFGFTLWYVGSKTVKLQAHTLVPATGVAVLTAVDQAASNPVNAPVV